MRRLILLRHGVTEGNRRRLYYGATDLPLCEEGLRQLQVRRGEGYPPIDGLRVYTSGLLRTEQTLAAIYGDVPHGVLPDFAEINFGAFEMHSYEELKDHADYQTWISGNNYENVCPGGESFRQMERRVLACYQTLEQMDEDALCVVHGGVIMMLMQHLFPQTYDNVYLWQPKPGCGYQIDLKTRQYQNLPL